MTINIKKCLSVLLSVFILLVGYFLSPTPINAQFTGNLGSISGAITWGSLPYPGDVRIAITGNSTGFNTSGNYNVNGPGTFATGTILPQDTYTVTAIARPGGNDIDAYATTLGTQTISVAAGQAVTGVNFDAFSLIGLVKGNLKINGVAAPGYIQFCSPLETDPCPNSMHNQNGPWFNIHSDGNFTADLRPGNYRAHAVTTDLINVGTVPVTVTAGQILEGSSMQFALNLGSISGSVRWGTEIPSGGGVGVFGDIVGSAGFSKSFTGADFNTGFILPPDTYTVSASIHDGSDPRFYVPLGSQTITIASGQAVTGVNFDAFNIAGAVKGNLKINGVAASGYVQFCGPLETDPCPNGMFNSNGPWVDIGVNGFTAYILPGQYRAHVVTQDLVNVGMVPITVTAGQILADSSLQFSISLGSISSSVTWSTDPYPDSVTITVTGNTTGFSTSQTGAANFNTGVILPPDTYTVSAVTNPHGDAIYATVLGTQTVTIAAGQAVTGINFDAFNLIGIVTGTLKINGAPATGIVQFCGPLDTDPCFNNIRNSDGPWFIINANGLFKAPVRPGNYRAHVVTSNLVDIGKVPVIVTAGQAIDLGTTIANVPVGQNVQVSLGGTTITFPEVTSAGVLNLTTTTQSQGGLPPSEYKFLGTYYELTTTATYTGPITVQFVYNDADVHGQESNLKLFHWDGTFWQNITVPPVDTVNNIITGSTQTLSPFAIGEPLNIPVVGTITAPLDPQPVNQSVSASASFTNLGSSGTYTAVWDWGDGTTSVGTVDQGNMSVANSHVYITSGVYTVKLSVTKINVGTGESVFQYIVVYNPEGGYVTGGGTIDSPIGAYVSDLTIVGKANFGFISKYEHGANVPSGQTEFQFKVANLKFHSTSYDWLVVAGAHAKYKGSGTINGDGDYAFMLTATDGQINGGGNVDKFRIKIWNKTTSQVIYDNQIGASDDADATMTISSGSIVIHN